MVGMLCSHNLAPPVPLEVLHRTLADPIRRTDVIRPGAGRVHIFNRYR